MNVERAKAKLQAYIFGIEDGWHVPTEFEKQMYAYFNDDKTILENRQDD